MIMIIIRQICRKLSNLFDTFFDVEIELNLNEL